MATDKQQHQEEKQTLLACALPVGTTLRSNLRQYKVISVLGAGGFGITYKVSANIEVGNVTVASDFVIKEHFLKGCWRDADKTSVLYAPPMAADIRQSRNDFIEEAHRLNHLGTLSPNIVKVNEVFEANDTAYYVMEYLDSGDLLSYVKHHGPMPEADAVELIVIIANAVALLHNNHLLHLDIKPDNIVLKTDKATGTTVPVLIDFGIAKHFDKSGHPTSHLTAKGASEGYAPIEQYTEITTFAPEIDVYALGATLYFLLTGKTPPKAFDIHTFDDLSQNLPANLSTPTLEALKGAMQPNKFNRTYNVEALIANLHGEHITTHDTNIIRPTTRFTPLTRHKKPLLIALVVLLAAIITVLCWPSKTSKPAASTVLSAQDTTDTTNIDPATSSDEPATTADETTLSTDAAPTASTDAAAGKQDATTPTPSKTDATTKEKQETDAEKYANAVASNNSTAIKQLAAKGYAKAYAKAAAIYLKEHNDDAANSYARRAISAGIGRSEAIKVIEVLDGYGYYDNGEHGGKPSY